MVEAIMEIDKYNIIEGDCEKALDALEAGSVQCCITSPPYFNLRTYDGYSELGREETPEQYVASMVRVFDKVRRVLKKDGTLWVVIGDSYVSNPVGTKHKDKVHGRSESGVFVSDGAAFKEVEGRKFDVTKHPVLKLKDLIGIPWRLAFALQADGWYLRADIIWCLSGGTLLYVRTPSGEKICSVRELTRKPKKTVELWNGSRWTKMLNIWQSDNKLGHLKITLRSGEEISCTPGHFWPTERGLLRADELRIGDCLISKLLPEPISPDSPGCLPDKEIGWLVGLYMAEGSSDPDGRIQIASHADEHERLRRLREIATLYHAKCHAFYGTGKIANFYIDSPILRSIINKYIHGSNSKNKRFTSAVWIRNNVFLQSIIDGYLSGDGHYDEKNDRWRLGFANNPYLTSGLRTLCGRLGYSLRLNKCIHKRNDKTYPGYRGQIRFTQSSHRNSKNDNEILKLSVGQGRNYWDIEVEDEPNLFALASGILTHNSKRNPKPEGVTDRPTKAHEYVFLLSKSKTYYYDAEAVKEDAESDNGVDGKRHKRSVWTTAIKNYRGEHSAVYPEELIEPCVLAGCPAGGVVLDCFSGTGSTGIACLQHGRRYLGIEVNPSYVSASIERLKAV